MKVLIVAKTKLGFGVCVGALDEADNSLRLYEQGWRFPPASSPYEIGQLWEMDLELSANTEPPHVEDAMVKTRKLIKKVPRLRTYLLQRISPWTGDIAQLFDGNLRFTARGRGYIQRPNLPVRSTWFWLPDDDLHAITNGKGKVYYRYQDSYDMSYVGLEPAVDVIPNPALVRVSLARWWKPPDAEATFPERCYLQLSGWYL
jgi:hypothetical protein